MSRPAEKLAGWEEILAAPEGKKAEVLGGELHVSPRPHVVHGRAQVALGRYIGGPYDIDGGEPGGWWIVVEPDLRFGPHDIVSPDLIGWRRERLPRLPESGPVEVVPDWVCEVVSPSSATVDRVRKSDLYLRSGVPHYWIADPDARLLEAFESEGAAWRRLGGWTDDNRPRIAPFAEIEIEIAKLFPPPE